MSRNRLFLIGIIFVVHLATPRAFAERTSTLAGEKRSLGANKSAVGHYNTTHSEGEEDATTEVSDETSGILAIPSILIQRILAVPRTIIQHITNWAIGIIGRISQTMVIEGWKFAVNFGIPMLDEMCTKIAGVESVPEPIKKMIRSAHSVYRLIKSMGYMKPA